MTPSEQRFRRFEESFGEDFYDLHYRFCRLVPGKEDRHEECTKNKEEVKSKILAFCEEEVRRAVEDLKTRIIAELEHQKVDGIPVRNGTLDIAVDIIKSLTQE